MNSGVGIFIENSEKTIVDTNFIENCYDGITIEYSQRSIINNNTIKNN